MAKGKQKRRRKPSKPDAAFQKGPVSVERYGRVTVVSSKWDPDVFARWKATWPELRRTAEEKVKEVSRRLIEKLGTVDPVELVATLFTHFGLMDPTTFVESESRSGEHYVEYVVKLIAALPEEQLGSRRLEDGESEQVIADLQELFDNAKTSAELSVDAEDASQLPEFRVQLLHRHLYVRGDSYPQHHRDLFRSFATLNDDQLLREHGISADALIGTLEGIDSQIDTRVQRMFEAAREMREISLRHQSGDQSALDELEKVREEMQAAFLPPLEFLRVDTEDRRIDAKVLELLSCGPGEAPEFLTGRFGGFPLNESLTAQRPLLRMRGQYVCPSSILLFRSHFEILAGLLGNARCREQFQSKRGRLLEELSVQYLSRIVPDSSVYRSLYYYDENGNRFETDALLLFDRTLFIVEAKAGSLSPSARRGSPLKIQADFAKLIGDAFTQGRRVRDHVRRQPNAQFFDEKDRLVVELHSAEIDDVFVVNPTFAVVDPIGAQLGTARRLGLLEVDPTWPWCVFINDLRIISELSHSPAEFTLYLQRRLATNQTPMAPHDELDLFCKFLSDGLYSEDEEFAGLGRVVLHGFTDMLDRWYIGGAFDGEAQKPALPIPRRVRALTDAIEASAQPRRTEAARAILVHGSDGLDQIDGFLGVYSGGRLGATETHDVSLASKDGPGLTVHVSIDGRMTEAAISHGRKRRHLCSASDWLAISYSPDRGTCDFAFVGDAQPSATELQDIDRMRRVLLGRFVASNGRPPDRNEACPCLSGKKYKKCCLQLAR